MAVPEDLPDELALRWMSPEACGGLRCFHSEGFMGGEARNKVRVT
jgi:hypothetical protein